MRVEDILQDLVAINTINDKNNDKLLDYIEKYLQEFGFKTDLKDKNLVMSIKNEYKLGFQGHIDTVSVSENWNTNPFILENINGNLYGLGTCDMKGGIAAILYAVRRIDFSKLRYGIKLYFTYDEEIGFNGINDLIKKNLCFPEYMVNCEPTNNIPMIGSKGLLEYEFIFKGISTHSSQPLEGKNSNKNAIQFLSQLLELERELKIKQYPIYDIPYTTMNIGLLNGGRAINIVPDNTRVLVDFRICANDGTMEYIKKYICNLTKDYDLDYKILNEIKPFINNSEMVNFYEKITNNKSKIFFGITESSFLNNNRVIIGPGPVTAHENNEYITIKSLNKTVDIYMKIIKKICEER